MNEIIQLFHNKLNQINGDTSFFLGGVMANQPALKIKFGQRQMKSIKRFMLTPQIQ